MANNKIILQPTEIAQWHSLVLEAQVGENIHFSEEIESYLVFLLMRFTTQPLCSNSILSLDFLRCLENIGNLRKTKLKDVGDKCLLFAGLFPGRAENMNVSNEYFSNLGRMCYGSLATDDLYSLAPLFCSLAKYFNQLCTVLNFMRQFHVNIISDEQIMIINGKLNNDGVNNLISILDKRLKHKKH